MKVRFNTMRRSQIRAQRGIAFMAAREIKVTETVIQCSDNGQHPLVYISLKSGRGRCQYCGQEFVRVEPAKQGETPKAA
jgi:uncharacterized Zn-finger protein